MNNKLNNAVMKYAKSKDIKCISRKSIQQYAYIVYD